jgi:mannose-1-phosphate guanylyltransferase/phosphomannomutase
MAVAQRERVLMAASQSGGFIFPAFLPAFDGAATLVNLLSLLIGSGQSLSEVVDGLPAVHIAHQAVPTPWDQKGAVMRHLVEMNQDSDLVLVDGIKINADHGWSLVLPDPEDPVTHVWVEADSMAEARARAEVQAARILELLS